METWLERHKEADEKKKKYMDLHSVCVARETPLPDHPTWMFEVERAWGRLREEEEEEVQEEDE